MEGGSTAAGTVVGVGSWGVGKWAGESSRLVGGAMEVMAGSGLVEIDNGMGRGFRRARGLLRGLGRPGKNMRLWAM